MTYCDIKIYRIAQNSDGENFGKFGELHMILSFANILPNQTYLYFCEIIDYQIKSLPREVCSVVHA